MIYVSVIDQSGRHIGDEMRTRMPHSVGGSVEMGDRSYRVVSIDRERVGGHGDLALITVDRAIKHARRRSTT